LFAAKLLPLASCANAIKVKASGSAEGSGDLAPSNLPAPHPADM
jgi:hypothetical protein